MAANSTHYYWCIGCVKDGNHEDRRELTEAEHQNVSAAIAYVDSFVGSPFSRLDDAVDKYWACKGRLIDALAAGVFQQQSDATPLSETFSEVLHRFRIYSDQTRVHLKQKYGRESDELKAFDQAKAAAFDRSFAYRLFTQLRNEDQHARRVVRVVGVATRPETGGQRHVVLTTLSDETLDAADAPGSRWDKKVARELRQLGRHVDVDPLLREFLDTVAEIESARLLGEAAHIERTILLLRSISNELQCGDGQPALLRFLVEEVNGENQVRGISRSPISLGTVQSLETALKNARELIGTAS
jgi:hypothetical protein